MIRLVSAPPGGGKSFYAVRAVAQALEEGRYVAGNVQLKSGWERAIARRSWPMWLRWGKRRRFLRQGCYRYHFSESLQELGSIRLQGTGEGRGLLILDEAHNWMNARSWSAKDRQEIVRLFSQHRKLGWDIILIAQHPDMIDKQVRNLVEYNVHLRNLKRAAFWGVPFFPFNLFLAVWCWHSAGRLVVKREVFRLTWRKDLYDTNATSHGLQSGDDAEGVIWLPSPPGDRPAIIAGTVGGSPPAAGRRAPQAPPSDEHADESGEPEAWPVSAYDGAPE